MSANNWATKIYETLKEKVDNNLTLYIVDKDGNVTHYLFRYNYAYYLYDVISDNLYERKSFMYLVNMFGTDVTWKTKNSQTDLYAIANEKTSLSNTPYTFKKDGVDYKFLIDKFAEGLTRHDEMLLVVSPYYKTTITYAFTKGTKTYCLSSSENLPDREIKVGTFFVNINVSYGDNFSEVVTKDCDTEYGLYREFCELIQTVTEEGNPRLG